MNYFKLRVNVELAGSREAIPTWEYDINAPNAEAKLNDKSLPDFDPSFSNLYLTKVTDVIDDSAIGGTGFIVNNKLKEIFAKAQLDTHKFYPLQSFKYGTEEKIDEEFYWFQIISSNYASWINYRNSSFYLFDDFEEEKIADLTIKNAENLLKEIKNTINTDNLVMYSKITFNTNFDNYDLFFMDGLQDNLFNFPVVSERLKTDLESNNIIEFEFKKVNIINV